MGKELNIAAILNEKPTETKLWSPMLGDCIYCYNNTHPEEIIIAFTDKNGEEKEWTFSYSGRTISAPDTAEVCLFPSKQMQDWSKFAWKKGDVLESDNKLKRCIFKEWANDDYTDFNCFAMDEGWSDYFSKINNSTFEYHKADDFVTELHIKRVEKKFGGKLNLETLDIEQPKQEFKNGDILYMNGSRLIYIFKKKAQKSAATLYYASLDADYNSLYYNNAIEDVHGSRLATNSEKQQLFSALEKEGKRWNPDTKQIEDLPKKCELKPMDWCLMKDSTKYWELCQFAYTRKLHGTTIYSAVGGLIYYKCIPYNEETAHLLGTTDEWKGGDG